MNSSKQVNLFFFYFIFKLYIIALVLSNIKMNPPQVYKRKIRRRQWQPTPVLLPGKSHGWRSLVGYSPWGHEELDRTEQLHFHFSFSCTGEGNGNPLQYACLENPRDGSLVGCHLWGRTESNTTDVTQQLQHRERLVFAWLLRALWYRGGVWMESGKNGKVESDCCVYRISFHDDENVLKWIMVMVVQLCEYKKN